MLIRTSKYKAVVLALPSNSNSKVFKLKFQLRIQIKIKIQLITQLPKEIANPMKGAREAKHHTACSVEKRTCCPVQRRRTSTQKSVLKGFLSQAESLAS